jgi:tRNA A-37 threonylcarbamoyl transferase component Bud32
MQCPTCKQVLDDGVRFCPNDGTPLTETSAARTVTTPGGTGRQPTRELDLPVTAGKRYQLVELRGGGGMAKVYRARDLTLDRDVAVKLINPELRADSEFDTRFAREAKIASQLNDPHIVEVYDFNIDTELGPYLVMQYLQGDSLREYLQKNGALPFPAAVQLGAQLLLALIHAHGKGIVHRDIKPDNIFLVNMSGVKLHVRVLDFGIARIYRRDDPTGNTHTITVPGSVLGTPRYMSPEQLGGQPVDARSDLYSAALVLTEALTNQLPYIGSKRLCELCPSATPALQELLEQCLRPNPDDRPQSAVEVYLRLQELGKASGILLLPPGALEKIAKDRPRPADPTVAYVPPAPTMLSRRRLLMVAGAVLVLGALAGLAVWLLSGKTKPAPEKEGLWGVKIDAPHADFVDQWKLTRIHTGSPWAAKGAEKKRLDGLLGRVLTLDDLKLSPEDLVVLETFVSPNDKVCLLVHEGKVKAAVMRDRHAQTGRGVRAQGEAGLIFSKYPESAATRDVKLPDGKGHVEVRRYETLGVGFEIEGPKIVAIRLYPPG